MPKTKPRKASRSKPKETHLPLDAFEEWVRKQPVRITPSVPEVRVPLDSYEEWISKQTKKKLEVK